jgi:aminopeptidase N
MNKSFWIICILFAVISINNGCKTKKVASETSAGEGTVTDTTMQNNEFMQALLDALNNSQSDSSASLNRLERRYNPSAQRINDLIHTRLEVSFDIPKQQLFGKATLDFKPYWYPVDSLILDAKSFDVYRVAMVDKQGNMSDLQYRYVNDQLRIALGKTFTRNETYRIYVQYTANPQRITAKGSEAISDAKGLYFINPKEEDPSKPTQIWTQGETESSSCWFPTIDKPNEKMTQELIITVPDKYVTLSNGLKTASKKNNDGTRSDSWKMDQPHAPYLAMMAIGEYAIVKDKWRKIEVNYYVEKEFEPYAKKIFGNTPEMLEFFSTKLGVDYPWQKYSQVVVRDYVSGAMENTTATIFGEFVQQTPKQMLDEKHESVIAHELFHHWFGDLATCESWANLPLNESFATYSEYLWDEYKYGRDAADFHLQEGLNQYIEEAFGKKVNLIRYDYENREDMFDRHSYQKGGCVLHMLRKYVGDEAFFEALKTYLNDHKYQATEIHHLRLAFEKVTGEDLNWFFDQWFLGKGHPTVDAGWNWDETAKSLEIQLEQVQDIESNGAFRLPMDVDIYVRGTARRVRISMDSVKQTIRIAQNEKPDFVNIDAERMVLGYIRQLNRREDAEWMLLNGKLYGDRFAGLEKVVEDLSIAGSSELIKTALRDKFWNIRLYALTNMKEMLAGNPEEFKSALLQLAGSDPESKVRAAATGMLATYGTDEAIRQKLESALNDSSAAVQSSALGALYESNPEKTKELLSKLESTAEGEMLISIAAIYAMSGTPDKYDFLLNTFEKIKNPNEKYFFVQIIGRYTLSQNEDLVIKSIDRMTEIARKASPWFVRLAGIQMLSEYSGYFQAKTDELTGEISGMVEKGAAVTAVQEKEIQKAAFVQKAENLNRTLEEIRNTETDPNLMRILNQFGE